MEQKTCTRCKTAKNITLFYINNSGRRSICKECENEKITCECQLEIRGKDIKEHQKSENHKIRMSEIQECEKVNFKPNTPIIDTDLPQEQVILGNNLFLFNL